MLTPLLCLYVGAGTDQLQRIVESHSASANAVRTLRCGFEFESGRGGARGTYARNGSDYRLDFSWDDGTTVTALSAGGQSKSLTKSGSGRRQRVGGSIIADDGDSNYDCDPCAYNQFTLLRSSQVPDDSERHPVQAV